jgi:hypothetical protein
MSLLLNFYNLITNLDFWNFHSHKLLILNYMHIEFIIIEKDWVFVERIWRHLKFEILAQSH